jgi:hypothetical protein
VAFVGFAYRWDYVKIFQCALAAAKAPVDRENIADVFMFYLRLRPTSAETWRKLEQVAQGSGSLAERFVEQRVAAEASDSRSEGSEGSPSPIPNDEPWTPERWDAFFGADLLEEPNGFAAVLGRSNYFLRGREGESGFWAQAFRRVRPGREVDFLERVFEHPSMGPLEIDPLLRAIPSGWRARLAVMAALKRGLERLLARHHTHVWHNRHYQRISIPLVTEAVNEPVSWVLETLFRAFGSSTTSLTSGEAFQLVSLLAISLSQTEALEALTYALSLVEVVLQPEDGDGPWSAELEPAHGVDKALAELLWGCLGAPQAAVRWQAAHTVRRLCAVEERESAVLDAVVALANGAAHGPFSDRRFVFYTLHARMWLLIGLARGALEHPVSVARYVDFVVTQAVKAETHVLIRHFAKEAAIALHKSASVDLDAGTLSKLEEVKHSPFPLVVSDRCRPDRTGPPKRDWASSRFHFAFDMDRYWFEPLAVVFHMTEQAVEDVAEGVVCDDWKIKSPGGWKEDARRRAGVLADDYSSHGRLPRVDSLDFYLSFHALMTTAGKLLRSTPVHADPGAGPRFEEWLERHLLTRKDGRWLADRRDPIPHDVRHIWRVSDHENWRWSVTADELRRAFDPGGDEYVVWGSWTTDRNSADQSVVIRSALVSPKTAPALLRALQTIDNPREVYLPSVGNEAEIEVEGFVLKGWIETNHRGKEFDEYDPWAGDIPYPPPAPARFVSEALEVTPHAEGRIWRSAGESALRAEIWGTGRDRDGYANDEGDRILIRKTSLVRLLSRLGLDLIVEVEVEHRLRRQSWRTDDDKFESSYPYFRLFLVRSDGSIHTI